MELTPHMKGRLERSFGSRHNQPKNSTAHFEPAPPLRNFLSDSEREHLSLKFSDVMKRKD